MPVIPLECRSAVYVTDLGVLVRAWRPYVDARFVTAQVQRTPVAYDCFMDTGAGLSVIPYSLWHGRNLSWTAVGRQLTQGGASSPTALQWQGIDCELRSALVYLVDRGKPSVQTGPLVVVAKFALRPHTGPLAFLENAVLLGMNFLADNQATLVIQGAAASLAGQLSIP
jgi:hypothetical protein